MTRMPVATTGMRATRKVTVAHGVQAPSGHAEHCGLSGSVAVVPKEARGRGADPPRLGGASSSSWRVLGEERRRRRYYVRSACQCVACAFRLYVTRKWAASGGKRKPRRYVRGFVIAVSTRRAGLHPPPGQVGLGPIEYPRSELGDDAAGRTGRHSVVLAVGPCSESLWAHSAMIRALAVGTAFPGRSPRPHSVSGRPVCSVPPRPTGADPVGSLTCALSTASFRADSATLPGSPHPDPTLPLRCARRARGTKAGAVASRPSSQPSCPLAAATRTCAHTRNVKARGVVPSDRPTEPHMPQWSATGSWSGTTRLAPRLPADLASA